MSETDQDLVRQVRGGNPGSFRVLVDRHARSVFRLAFRMTGNEADAEDIVQETFLRSFRQLGQYEARASFSTWIYRIAANCCLDVLRARSRRHETEEPLPGLVCVAPAPDRVALAAETRSAIGVALGRLTEQERVAFLLRHYEGRSIHEVSLVLDISETAAKNSIFRAVQKMRQSLEGRF